MKLDDKLIKNQDEYIKELQALLRQKEEENALLRKDISNKEIQYKSQISELNKSKKELLSSNNKLKIENDKVLKAIKKSDNRIYKLEKENEKCKVN